MQNPPHRWMQFSLKIRKLRGMEKPLSKTGPASALRSTAQGASAPPKTQPTQARGSLQSSITALVGETCLHPLWEALERSRMQEGLNSAYFIQPAQAKEPVLSSFLTLFVLLSTPLHPGLCCCPIPPGPRPPLPAPPPLPVGWTKGKPSKLSSEEQAGPHPAFPCGEPFGNGTENSLFLLPARAKGADGAGCGLAVHPRSMHRPFVFGELCSESASAESNGRLEGFPMDVCWHDRSLQPAKGPFLRKGSPEIEGW